jgi:hypothetical protein
MRLQIPPTRLGVAEMRMWTEAPLLSLGLGRGYYDCIVNRVRLDMGFRAIDLVRILLQGSCLP